MHQFPIDWFVIENYEPTFEEELEAEEPCFCEVCVQLFPAEEGGVLHFYEFIHPGIQVEKIRRVCACGVRQFVVRNIEHIHEGQWQCNNCQPRQAEVFQDTDDSGYTGTESSNSVQSDESVPDV